MRHAGKDDLPGALSWLATHGQGPVFLRANLLRHGLAGASDHPHAVHLWQGDGGLIGLTNAGVLLPQMAHADKEAWRDARAALAGRAICGIIGAETQARQAVVSTGLTDAPTRVDRVEQDFALNLADLVVPEHAGLELRPIAPADLPWLDGWNAAYQAETLGADPASAREAARRNIAAYHADDSHQVLWRGDQPVAFTGFNARLPDLVQIGGVYTPPPLRGQGYARAADAAAARAYVAIGFRPAGQILIVIYPEPQQVMP